MHKRNLLIRSGILGILISALFTSCGPEFNELEIPPIENYKIGLPLIDGDGSVGFMDLLSDEDLEQLQTDPTTGELYFAFEDSFDIASTDELVQAFGSSSEDDFFSINFPDPINSVPGGRLPVIDDVSVAFTMDASGTCDEADFCIALANDVEDEVAISYIRFERGGLQVTYTGNRGDRITLEMTGVESPNGDTISETQTVTFSGNNQVITLDLTNVALNLMEATPTVSISLVDTDGNPTGFITGIEMTPTNTADRLKLRFGQVKEAVIDIPSEEIDTDYLSDIFPEDAVINFKSPTVEFRFNNPVGAGISIDLSENNSVSPAKRGIFGENAQGERSLLTFTDDEADALEGVSCSQIIDVLGATDFDQPVQTSVYVCESADLLNIRPVKIAYDGQARYSLGVGDEVLFSKGDEVKAYFTAKVPLYIGFTNMVYESGSSLDFEFTSEAEEINKATLRSQVTNSLPIGGSLKLITKETENGDPTAEILINGGNDSKLIVAAKTSADGKVTESSVNYLETELTEEQVRAILNAGYLDVAFELEADADATTSEPEPVQITTDQTMTFEMGLFLEGTINFESE